jgi:beta-glucosidase
MTLEADRLASLIAQLTIEEKVALVSGADFWTTTAIDRIGLRAMVLSDGPSGVRGPVWDERSPSLNLPSATMLAASWDPAIAYRYAVAAANEARRKGVDIVLGPTINLHRSPLGGRHFEAFSEDPLLTGTLAASYVRGLQDNGVAATPKHYVANDSETDRFTLDVSVDERTLREIYLLPFELAIEAGAWVVMSAYNSVDGVTMTENTLLESPLKSEWGFDGVVVSDWTAVRSLAAANASQDLAMPGPALAWSEQLVAAVLDKRVPEELVDRKVARLLTLANRVGALDDPAITPAAIDGRAFAREAASQGMVLLANRAELPWRASDISSIAVIGQNARYARTQGGGSATVIPERVVSPLAGIQTALDGVEIVYEEGAVTTDGIVPLALDQMTNPITGMPGLRASFVSERGELLLAEDRRSTELVWLGGDAPLDRSRLIVLDTVYRPTSSGRARLGFASSKHCRVYLDGELVLDEQPEMVGTDLGAALLDPPSATVEIDLVEGVPVTIRAQVELSSVAAANEFSGAAAVTVGFAPQEADPDELIAKAAAAAARCDVALVVVGTNSSVESEGFDRTDLRLPGRQDDLVRAVAAANPRTVVVVNAGAPVLMPWRDDVAAVLLGFFGGQEFGAALADVVLGRTEPGGRLTTTWPTSEADVPVLSVTPVDGVLAYTEGIHVGYRAWLKTGRTPAYPFGWGLGYTTWDLSDLVADDDFESGGLTVSVAVTNTGARAGKAVVQVYAERPDSAVDRPARWLIGSAVAFVEPGQTDVVTVPVRARAFAHWNGGRSGAWEVEPGTFAILAGSSVLDLPLSIEVAR